MVKRNFIYNKSAIIKTYEKCNEYYKLEFNMLFFDDLTLEEFKKQINIYVEFFLNFLKIKI